jgi:CheY-like chemotaxis protein
MPKSTLYALVVEDDDENFDRYRNFLDPLGLVVHRAASFPEARGKILAFPYSLQILDLDMQGAGDFFGINHLAWMHNNQKPIPTIIISYGADMNQAAEAEKTYEFVRLRVYTPDFANRISEINATIEAVLNGQQLEPDPLTFKDFFLGALAVAFVLATILAYWRYAPPPLLAFPFPHLFSSVMVVTLLCFLQHIFKLRGVRFALAALKMLLGLGKGRGKMRKDKDDKSD